MSLLVVFEKKLYWADFICLVYRNYDRNDRLRGSGITKKYYSEVKKRIDKGQMVVGLLPENGGPAQQSGGGHMRVFIGYNDKTKELIFSDSWGPGHEMKRITAKAAFVVTSGIYEISP